MKMFNITGWKDIFYFTFVQTLKNKGYRFTLIFLCIVAAAALPVTALLSDFTSDEEVNITSDENTDADVTDINEIKEVDSIYIMYDESDTELHKLVSEWQDKYVCDYIKADSNLFDEKKKDINTDNTYGLLAINYENGLYYTEITVGWETMDHMSSIDVALEDLSSRLEKLQVEKIVPGITVPVADEGEVPVIDGYVGDADIAFSKGINIFNYMIQLVFIMVMILLISFSGESIASSVVSEKAGKMVEYLMITVKPMAILVGKVFAVLLSVIIQFAAMVICGIVSAVVCNILNGNFVSNYLANTIESLNNSQNTFSFNPFTIFITLLFFIGGLLLYGLIASLCGAAVSKLEELSEGVVMFTFVLLISSYMAMGVAMIIFSGGYSGEPGLYEMLVYLLPTSSAFSVPQNLITGYIGYGPAIISLVILYGTIVLLAILSSKVYEYMLFYNGATLKFKDIIHIALHGKVKEAK